MRALGATTAARPIPCALNQPGPAHLLVNPRRVGRASLRIPSFQPSGRQTAGLLRKRTTDLRGLWKAPRVVSLMGDLRGWIDPARNIRASIEPVARGPWLDRDHGDVMLPPDGRRPRQLVIFLHGVNDRGKAWRWMADIWRKHLPDAAFIFPDGIERSRATPGMFQWWELRSLDSRDVRAGVRRAAPRFQRFLYQVQDALQIAPEATILGGFSQGAMLALHIGERNRPSLAGVLAFSGMAADLPHDRGKVRSAPPIFLYHGTQDRIVPFSAHERTRSRLSNLGFDVATRAAEGVDHTIDAQGAEHAGRLMRRWLQDPAEARKAIAAA